VTAAQVELPVVGPAMPPAGWRNAHLSVSRIKLLEECALAFYRRYVERVERPAGVPDPEPAELGTVLHAALERTYLDVVRDEYEGPFPVDALLEHFRAAWGASGLGGFELYQEGRAILRRYATDAGRVDHLGVLAVEREFNLLLTADGAVRLVAEGDVARYRDVPGAFVVNGYIDRIDRMDAQTVEVVDYKSGRLLYTRGEIDDDLQLSVYAVAAALLYPWAKRIKLSLQMLRHGVRQQTERSPEQLRAAREYVRAMGARSERGPYLPRLNPHCGTCEYSGRCEAYRQALTRKFELAAVHESDLPAVAEARERVAAIAKAAYARRDKFDAILRAAVEAAPGGSLELSGRTYRIEQYFETDYDAGEMLALFARAGVDLSPALSVGVGALEALLDRVEADESVAAKVRGLLRVQVAAKSHRIPQKPRLDVRTTKRLPR
jgi:putative RecB family exonuclease